MGYLNFKDIASKLKQRMVTTKPEICAESSETIKVTGWGTARPFFLALPRSLEKY